MVLSTLPAVSASLCGRLAVDSHVEIVAGAQMELHLLLRPLDIAVPDGAGDGHVFLDGSAKPGRTALTRVVETILINPEIGRAHV